MDDLTETKTKKELLKYCSQINMFIMTKKKHKNNYIRAKEPKKLLDIRLRVPITTLAITNSI